MINEERRVVQNEGISALEQNNFNGFLIIPTGVGKSWIMIEALKRLQKIKPLTKIWYLCNSIDLRDVGFKEELEKWDGMEFYDRIERMCYQTACKRVNESVDVILADEADFSITPKYILSYTNNRYSHLIAVSATLDNSKEELAQTVGTIIFRKELQEVENNGILNKSIYHFVNYQVSPSESKVYNDFIVNLTSLIEDKNNAEIALSLEENPKQKHNLNFKIFKLQRQLDFLILKRKQFLNNLKSSKNVCRKLMKEIYEDDVNNKILVFCESNKQADSVCKYSYHSDSQLLDNLSKFKNNDIKFLSVCGKVNRGINISGVNHVIFESCNKSKTQLTQRLGRGKRLNVNEFLNVYFLIPYYYNNGKLKSTKVLDWIYNAGRDLNLNEAKRYRFKQKINE